MEAELFEKSKQGQRYDMWMKEFALLVFLNHIDVALLNIKKYHKKLFSVSIQIQYNQ